MTSKAPKTPDKALGRCIANKRLERGWSRQQLARKIEVTHQQLEKYEHGKNRVSTGRLRLIANALGEPLDAFFDVTEELPERPRLILELVRNFQTLNESAQEAVNNLVSALAKGEVK